VPWYIIARGCASTIGYLNHHVQPHTYMMNTCFEDNRNENGKWKCEPIFAIKDNCNKIGWTTAEGKWDIPR